MFEFRASDHSYWVDGRRVPGVTSVLSPLYDWLGIPADVLEAKSQLGVDVHAACEYEDQGGVDEDSVDDAVRPYLLAYRRFMRENDVEWVGIEERLYHPARGYAGTLDRRGRINNFPLAIVDLKTVVTPSPAIGVQVGAYADLVTANDPAWRYPAIDRFALQLRHDATYRLIPYTAPDDLACFYSLLSLHTWKRRHQSKGS